MKSSSLYIVSLAVTILLPACATTVDVLRLDREPRAQRGPATIEVLAAEPTRPYVAIALVSVSAEGRDEDGLRRSLIRTAAHLGADAVILDAHSLSRHERELVLSAKVVAYRDSMALRRASR
jgi:hypothetical protein